MRATPGRRDGRRPAIPASGLGKVASDSLCGPMPRADRAWLGSRLQNLGHLLHNGAQEGSLVETSQAGLVGHIQRLSELLERDRAIDL